MKKLGKNKKKQWKHCYADLESKLDATRKQQQILKDGFILGVREKKKQRIIKGDKNSAKAFPDIPSFSDGEPRMKRYTVHKPTTKAVDLWQNVPAKSDVQNNALNVALPPPGQSYNPSVEDHHTMLSALAKAELMKKRREEKTERFLKGIGTNNRKIRDPVEEARSFVQILSSNSDGLTTTVGTQDTEELGTVRKPKKVNVAKRMSVELENIPKLLKEIKRENQTRLQKAARMKARKERRRKLKKMDLDVAFQLPNELVPALRKLTPEVDLLREIERRKNKCPRARKTLGLTKNTKSYERR